MGRAEGEGRSGGGGRGGRALCLASLGGPLGGPRPNGSGQTDVRVGPPPVLIPVSLTNAWRQGTWEWGVDSEQADSGAGMFVAGSLGEGPFGGPANPASEMAPTSHRSGSHLTTCQGALAEKASWSRVNWGCSSVSSIALATSPFCSEAAGSVPSPWGSRFLLQGPELDSPYFRSTPVPPLQGSWVLTPLSLLPSMRLSPPPHCLP